MIARAPLLLALALAAGPAPAQEGSDLAPEAVTPPQTRPGTDEAAGAGEPNGAADPPPGADDAAADVPAPADESVPRPEARSEGDAPPAAPEAPPETDEPSEAGGDDGPAAEPSTGEAPDDANAEEAAPADPPMREVLTETPEELAACLAALDALGVSYERSQPLAGEGNPDCGIANPLIVTEIAPGVAFGPPSTMRCEAALAAARWVADVVAPMAAKLGRGDLAGIDQGTSYLCRPRADGLMSEHAWGNALDVMGFRFSQGDPIPVVPRMGDGTIEEAFQRAVRAGACLDFATVLGPGSDEDHADHLHFDVKARDGGYRICE